MALLISTTGPQQTLCDLKLLLSFDKIRHRLIVQKLLIIVNQAMDILADKASHSLRRQSLANDIDSRRRRLSVDGHHRLCQVPPRLAT